jgi:hypothetical protein
VPRHNVLRPLTTSLDQTPEIARSSSKSVIGT